MTQAPSILLVLFFILSMPDCLVELKDLADCSRHKGSEIDCMTRPDTAQRSQACRECQLLLGFKEGHLLLLPGPLERWVPTEGVCDA